MRHHHHSVRAGWDWRSGHNPHALAVTHKARKRFTRANLADDLHPSRHVGGADSEAVANRAVDGRIVPIRPHIDG